MSDQVKITSEAALMMQKMLELDPEEERYQVLQTTLKYKAAWLELGEKLNVVAENKEYKEWSFKTFKDYCQDELQIRQATARKLVRGFQWIDREAPEFLPNPTDEVSIESAAALRAVPDVETIAVLISAEKEVQKERLAPQEYQELKARALAGEDTAREIKRGLKEALPEPEKDPTEEQIKTLRRTLTATERIITQLEEAGADDEEVLGLANQLRERVFELVSKKLDDRAYGEGEASAEAQVELA